MKTIVLVKQTPDTAQLSATMDGLQLMSDNGSRIVNPWDEYAIETALLLHDEHGGDCTLLSMGEPDATAALKHGLAMGAGEAILLHDEGFTDSDSLGTARILAAAAQKIGEYDLILAGKSAIDGDTGQTAVQVAALLDIPFLGGVTSIDSVDLAAKSITVTRAIDGGRQTMSSSLPAVISVLKEIGEPRYPNIMRIRRAAKATILQWGLTDLALGADSVGAAGAQVQWPEVSLPPVKETQVERIDGDPQQIARTLVDRLLTDKVI